jgi:beta-phosphoglucomutase
MSSPLRPRAILLDLDGTLANSLPVMRHAYQRFLEECKAEPTDAEFESLNGPPLSEIVRRLKASHSLEGDEAELLATYVHIIDKVYSGVTPRSGAGDLLQKARANRCVVGIVTSNSTRRTQTWLKTVGMSHLIDFIVSGEDVQCGKPHPEPYRVALEQASCPSSEVVAVEDSLQGGLSALDAGLKTFILTDGVNRESPWPQGAVPIQSLECLGEKLW